MATRISAGRRFIIGADIHAYEWKPSSAARS
jgi:hypothetical protein